MSSGWGCPHEYEGKCQRRGDEECDPGADGCVLEEGLRRSAEALQPGARKLPAETVGSKNRRRK